MHIIEIEDDGCLKGKEKKGKIVEYNTKKEKIEPPKLSKDEKNQTEAIHSSWRKAMENLMPNIERVQNNLMLHGSDPPKRNYSYLENFPIDISQVAHFERILKKENALKEAQELLGDSPIVFRKAAITFWWGDETSTGFAIGEKGIVYVGYSYSETKFESGAVSTDTEEVCYLYPYEKLPAISTKWWENTFRMNYFEEKKGEIKYHKKTDIPKIKRRDYYWGDKIKEEKDSVLNAYPDHPWYAEYRNFPWIIADAVYAKSGKSMPASCLDLGKSFKNLDPKTYQARYLF